MQIKEAPDSEKMQGPLSRWFLLQVESNGATTYIYECKKIWEMKKQEKLDMPQYEMINNGNLNEQLTVAKIFKENYKILEIYKNNDDKKKCIHKRNQVTDDLSCLQYCNTEWKYID